MPDPLRVRTPSRSSPSSGPTMLQNTKTLRNPSELQTRFLLILPGIERHGRVYFRHLSPGPRRDDAIAEVVGIAWKWYRRLVQRGKDPHRFTSTLASYAARAVKSGRRVCGQE